MTIIDKVIAAVAPLETEDERRAARTRAKQASNEAPWLGRVLEHHQQIEAETLEPMSQDYLDRLEHVRMLVWGMRRPMRQGI